jgi:hypothetical protein
MKYSLFCAAFMGFLCFTAFSACGVDGRSLSYEYPALETAGTSQSAGADDSAGVSGMSSDGDSGTTADGASGASDATSGGSMSGGGSPSREQAGDSNGESVSGATLGGSAGDASAGTGGNSVSSTGGSAGAVFVGPCGDLNNDSIDDCSQTLVQNSRFDATASGWDAEPSLTAIWSANDASGKANSGSLLLTNSAPIVQATGSIMIGAHQCIAAIPDTNYDIAAHVLLAAGQTAGAGGINVWLFDDGACQGNVVAADTPISGGRAGQWIALSGTLWVPGGVYSMSVRLVAIKPFALAALNVSLDDVLVAKH